MKENWSKLPLSRRILCIVNAVLIPIFLIIYLTYGNKAVIRFNSDLLLAEKGENEIFFSGEIKGKPAELTLFSDAVLQYTLDGVEYGPFTLVDDPTAVPPDSDLAVSTFYVGIEIREDGEPIFRGGYHDYMTGILLVHNDGTFYSEPAPGEPDLHLIFHFLRAGNIVRQGNWIFFLVASLFVALTLLTGFFKEPFFRAHMPLTKEEKELQAQEKVPLLRKVLSWSGWVALTFGALFFYIGGLMAF